MEYQGNSRNDSTEAGNAGAQGSDRKSSTAQQLIRDNVQYLIAQLEAGHSEALTAFLDAMAHFHHYSLGNVLLIARQRPGATHVAGMRTWNQLGRRVKRGEKGILILAPMITKHRRQPERNLTPDETAERKPVLRGFRHVYVWDEAQTEGAPLATLGETTGEVGTHLDRLREFVAARGICLEYREDIRPALGISYGGRIALLPGQSKAEEFTALVHETTHEFLHHAERPTDQTVRETEAEAVAFVVARAVGLNASTSVSYIQLYHGDAELLIESLQIVQQTASLILSAIAAQESGASASPLPSSSILSTEAPPSGASFCSGEDCALKLAPPLTL
jgi:antirestriction protein ArdC